MIKEIGSDFWNKCPQMKNQVFLLAGRTALEFIIRDILKSHTVFSVLLPSYCCHTMIEPFVRHGIKTRFYDVFFDDSYGLTADISELKENEIFYYMEYFGFSKISGIDIHKIQCSGNVIIEDMTHSWLYKTGQSFGDYSYVSYRKWIGFEAIATATKYKGFFSDIPKQINEKYFFLRKRASELKRNFIENGKGNKEEFLSLFAEAEKFLEEDYIDYLPMKETMADFLCLDKKLLSEQRKKNANLIIEELKKIPQVRLIFDELQADDVPLFVPILIKEDRSGLRKFLIDNQVYCPIHWPISEYHVGISGRAKKVYQEELSLICDQRYGLDDIRKMLELIKKFYTR